MVCGIYEVQAMKKDTVLVMAYRIHSMEYMTSVFILFFNFSLPPN